MTPSGVYQRNKPAEGGAVTEVRGPIRDMLAPGSDSDFKESLPDQTSTEDAGLPEPKKRTRRSKAEIAAARGDTPQTPVDKRLERAKAKASGLGGAKLVQSGFAIAGKPLDEEEKEDVDDQFYLIAAKAGIDPSGSWLFVALYTIALLARLIMSRTDLGEKLRELFLPKKDEEANVQGPTTVTE
jgi:hypothetical protein